MPDLSTQVLEAVASAASLPLLSSEAFPTVDSLHVKSALDSLASRDMITYVTIDKEEAELTDEAAGIVKDGSHEAKVYEAVCKSLGGLKISELAKAVGASSAKVGQGKAFKEGWIRKDGDKLVKAVSTPQILSIPLLQQCQQRLMEILTLPPGSINQRCHP